MIVEVWVFRSFLKRHTSAKRSPKTMRQRTHTMCEWSRCYGHLARREQALQRQSLGPPPIASCISALTLWRDARVFQKCNVSRSPFRRMIDGHSQKEGRREEERRKDHCH